MNLMKYRQNYYNEKQNNTKYCVAELDLSKRRYITGSWIGKLYC